ncbi:D-isomer specific 2-hydroxyacid dehydrogenase family protein [Magnetovibrio sp. PR-2]|uniref:D-isomer specific 2-hydroxyacid dehydrogenase family protein n=1 Tax=Magnetovibrio sp. PR-2 TaxID=3120356 RepID=UPI002FCDE661
MQKPRALYYRIMQYSAENKALVERLYDVTELDDPRYDTDEILAGTQVLFAPLGFLVDQDKMDRCPKLKAVVSNTTGIPHIDAEEAGRRSVAVCALHDEQAFLDTITPTAELTIGLMLSAWRRIPACHAVASGGDWNRRDWGAPRMFSRMRLGLVGHGRLGKKTAEIAQAMGMMTAFFDPYVEGSVDTIEELAAQSDILSLHAPANEETRNLVSRSVLEKLPKGAMVVNTARGELLDTEALLDMLESGHLYAAGLDTIDGEYDPEFSNHFGDSRIARYAREHDNLVLTPHIGGSTTDAWLETERFVIIKAAKALGIDDAE